MDALGREHLRARDRARQFLLRCPCGRPMAPLSAPSPLLEVATLRHVHTMARDLHVHNEAVNELGWQPHRRATEANQILLARLLLPVVPATLLRPHATVYLAPSSVVQKMGE